MQTIKNLFSKYEQLIRYGFFGVLTTIINFSTFYLLDTFLFKGEQSYLLNNAIAWFISVTFAYITNKLFVFNVKGWSAGVLIREISEFFGGRIFSFAIEEAGLWLLVDAMNLGAFSHSIFGFELTGELISKMVVGIVVVILNYFISKLVVFRKK